MSEVTHLINTLKRQLKQQGKTYRDVALALDLSEASVKRLFASESFALDRLVEVCNLLGFSVAELAQEAARSEERLRTLTVEQEKELVSDPKLLLVAVCALNHWTMQDIVAVYRLSEAECIQRLARLDRLRLIALMPGNRIRLTVARDFDWIADGPIRGYFRAEGMGDFMAGRFGQANESLAFTHAMLTDAAIEKMQAELRQLRARFAELHEESLGSPLGRRRGTGLLVAMREWEPAQFTKLRR
jgi:transcriptional regulator with XRE-family HTH domain